MHYPVVNKVGDVITSAVTNLDLHDIARAGKTYGVKSYYVVTPLSDQQVLVERIAGHWTTGVGGKINPKRCEALELIRIKDSLEAVIEDIEKDSGASPRVVVTSAKVNPDMTRFETLREIIKDGKPYLLTFGTAWGLTHEFVESADYTLEPITGISEYNHLSVRSAASIVLDRLTRQE